MIGDRGAISRRRLTGGAAAVLAGAIVEPAWGSGPPPRAANSSSPGAAAAAAAATLLAADSLNGPLWLFGRCRGPDDDTRLHLTRGGGAAATVRATLSTAPAFYGLDFSHAPTSAAALRELYAVFEGTPLGTLDFYLAPTVGGVRSDTSWMTVGARELLDQGWALIPIYLGSQQYSGSGDDSNGVKPPWFSHLVGSTIAIAKTQGTRDGHDAVKLAGTAGFPAGSRIYLDIETAGVPAPKPVLTAPMLSYVAAWRSALAASVYGFGFYGLTRVCDRLHAVYPTASVLAARGYYPVPINDGAEPKAGVGVEVTLDVRAVPFAAPSATAPGFAFTGWADGWQWCLDWPGRTADVTAQPPTHRLPLYRDTGLRRDWALPGGRVDWDLSRRPDPAHTAGGTGATDQTTKTSRRRSVATLHLANSTVRGGSSTALTVNLDRPAAKHGDVLVLLRSSAPEALLPNSVRIPAGARSAQVTVSSVPGTRSTTAVISARTLAQLRKPTSTATLAVLPT